MLLLLLGALAIRIGLGVGGGARLASTPRGVGGTLAPPTRTRRAQAKGLDRV